MSQGSLHLVIVAFNGMDKAESELHDVPESDDNFPSVVILVKDENDQVTFKDVGKTPKKEMVVGAVLGGVVGVLTGGAGLALGALGAVIGHHREKKQQAKKTSLELTQIAASMGPDSSAIIGIGPAALKESVAQAFEDRGGKLYEAVIPTEMVEQLDAFSDENYQMLLDSLAQATGGAAKKDVPYPRI